jgi:two-component system NarL family sensor kinase
VGRLRHPVVQYLVAGAVMLVAIAAGTTWLSGRAATNQARSEARRTTELLARSVVEPAMPRRLVDVDAGAIDRFDRQVRDALQEADVRRVKVWRRDGTIVYSDQSDLIGQRFGLGEAEIAVLDGAGTEAEVSDLSKPENRLETSRDGLLEVYTGIRSPEGEALLFEAYYPLSRVDLRRSSYIRAFRPITVGGLLLFLLATTPLIAVLTKRLEQSAAERERLLVQASGASEAERRRIARDLHDGVVQDLAATAFALSATARDKDVLPATSTRLLGYSASLRDVLRSLRSFLVEIHPPALQPTAIVAALEDLVAPAAAHGVEATVSVDDIEDLDAADAALLWRVAQESVRNSLRHASASHLWVTLTRGDGGHRLVVRDDGRGFDPALVTSLEHFGLRGLASLAHDGGGRLVVESRPRDGTTVTLEVRS